jgi:uncharacterized protein
MPRKSKQGKKNADMKVQVPVAGNPLLEQVLDLINSSPEITTLWKITNVNAIKRLGMTDHGPHHFQIVANNALIIQRLLMENHIPMSICADFGLSEHHAEVVVLLTSLLHDVGMSIHRIGHEEFGLFMVNTLLRELLVSWPIEARTIVISEVLHAIISHRSDGKPLTIEAGIVRVADALDMAKGRSRIPYEAGKIDIHSVSAMAIDSVEIKRGEQTPVEIDITMNHTAGIFQVDELFKRKVTGSGIERYLRITIYIITATGKQLFKDFYR